MSGPGVCVVEILEAGEAEPRQHVLNVGGYVIGSSAQCDLCLRSTGVSRRHLELEVLADGGVLLTDLGSRNGTWFAQRRVTRQALTEPARFRLGGAQLAVYPDTEAAHVLPLPSVAGSQGPPMPPLAASQATDLPGTTWLLLQDVEALLDDRAALDAGISRLLGLWLSHLRAGALRLRRCGADAVLFAAGEPSGDDSTSCYEISAGDLQLDIERSGDSGMLGDQQRLALRIGLLVLAARLWPAAAENCKDGITGEPAELAGSSPASLAAGVSAPMQSLYQLAARVAKGDVAVLVRGESGVGKELLARWIHDQSPRRDGPFLAINCAALPAELLETEIFGIERGVATGVEAREGLLERARGGTLFLDELGDMAASTQAKVLRALESDSVYRVGGSRPITLDVRFVAATHQDMAQRIADGNFRLDLFHRIAAVELTVPPLRERRADIAQLATRFLAEELSKLGRSAAGITEAALATLCEHDWPGNVRELRNEMARSALLLDAHQPLDIAQLSSRIVADDQQTDLSLATALLRAERRAFDIAHTLCRDDHAGAMALLDLPRSSYFRRLRQLRGDDTEVGS